LACAKNVETDDAQHLVALRELRIDLDQRTRDRDLGQCRELRVQRFVEAAAGSANFEIKIGDPSGNVYLSAASVLAAALNGLEQKAVLPDGLDRDPVTYPEVERPPRLPLTLEDALTALERSEVIRAALGDAIVEPFLAVRRHDAESLGELSLEDRVRALRWRY